jgi:hypothetical protein
VREGTTIMSETRGYENLPQNPDVPPLPSPDKPRYEGTEGLGGGEIFAPRTSGENEEYQIPQSFSGTLETEPVDDDIDKRTADAFQTGDIPATQPEATPAPAEKEAKKGLLGTAKRKIGAAVVATAAVAGVAGALFLGGGSKQSDEPNENLPPQGEPVATATANPGEKTSEPVEKNTFEQYTTETFPFMVNGETIVGEEALRDKFGFDGSVLNGLTSSDEIAAAVAQEVNTKLNLVNTFGLGPEKEFYKDYVSANGMGKGIKAVAEDWLLPALDEIWGVTTPTEILKPGVPADDHDILESPKELTRIVKTSMIGNLDFPEDGVDQYEITDTSVMAAARDRALMPVPGAEDQINNVVLTSVSTIKEIDENGLVKSETPEGEVIEYTAMRVPGPNGEDSIVLCNMAKK